MTKSISFTAIATVFLFSFPASEINDTNKLNQQELYSCAWFPICGDPDFPQIKDVKPDSSSKDKKDQKASGRMA